MNFLLLLFAGLLGTLLAYSICCLRPRPSIVEPLIVYDVSMNTRPVNIAMREEDRSERSVPILSKIPFVSFGVGSPENTLYVTDAFTYEKKYSPESKVYTSIEDEKVFLLIKKRDSHSYETLADAIRRKKTFYCGSTVKETMLDFVCLSNNIDPMAALRAQDQPSADIVAFFGSINNPLPAAEQVDFVSYDRFDINLLRFYIPYCKTKNIPLDTYFKGSYKDRFPIKTCLCIDMLLYGSKELKAFPRLGGWDAVPLNSFLSLFFEFFEESQQEMAATAKGDQVLEQFDLPTVEASRPVRGYRDGLVFYSEEEEVDGVPITPGMTVVLKNQPNDFENDRYVAESARLWKGNKKRSDAAEICIDKPEASRQECPGVWDAPCQADTDCPYFQKNRVYHNYFGGCVDGRCQMPLGVKTVGYRGASGQPMCYGDPSCKNGDYAFPLDTFERLVLRPTATS